MRSTERKKTVKTIVSAESLINKIDDIIRNSEHILIATHIDPDGDAIGTQLAFGEYLKALGKKYIMVRDSDIPDKYKFLPGINNIRQVSEIKETLQFDTALILECPTLERLGEAKRFISGDVTLINIDHHQDSQPFGKINWIDTGASSVGEMAFEYFQEMDAELSPDMAVQLYTAILTDTGRFRFSSTSPRTMHIAGILIAAGADPRHIFDNVYYNIRPEIMILRGKVLNTVEFHHNNQICVLTLTENMMKESGAETSDTEGLVDFTMFVEGVLAGILLKEISTNETKISLRAKGNINVAEICRKFHGGGHVNAAGCKIDLPVAQAKAKIIGVIKEVIDEQKR
jgi:phosphoesterase RecJ-like protein